ncbi:MAG: tryptophan--tRNA ligase, partial [Chthoniobacterales bacterium]
GTKKMSKSDPSDYSRINLADSADVIAQKIRKAKTDSDALPSEVAGLAHRPEIDNLIGIFAALNNETKADALKTFGGTNFATFKSALVELTVEKLAPIGRKMAELTHDPAHIDRVLGDGAARARIIAHETMKTVKDILGFVR